MAQPDVERNKAPAPTVKNNDPIPPEFEGDEGEWQAPDVKPKYPTDVQASSENLNRPSQDEIEDLSEDYSDDDDVLDTENPELLNRR
jgi:hypothetical protein